MLTPKRSRGGLGCLLALLSLAACEQSTRRPLDGATVHPDLPVLVCPTLEIKKSCADGWCAVPAGCFLMGTPDGELCRETDEPQHKVQLTRRFEIGETEVSQAGFQQVMGYAPSSGTACGTDCPVENVTWSEAAAYGNALSKAKGLAACYDCSGSGADVSCMVATPFATGAKTIYDCPGYRLPTEAEWEHAARAGTTTPFYSGAITSCLDATPSADAIAWYKANSGAQPHKVAQKTANALGLYDVSGNVWEWANDWYDDLSSTEVIDPPGPDGAASRTIRGGSYSDTPGKLRMAHRTQQATDYRSGEIGFRCARTLP
jgi:formylglycine-generating enzyme required for sulfatase activity